MLKVHIRSEIKEIVILLVFSGLMVETLSSPTIVVVVIGAIMVWFRKRPNHIIRNILTLGLFGAYWMTYGKVIDPEVGMNFLTSIVVIKLLEKETERDRYMIFFGIILLISAGSLFQRSLSYVSFFTLSFFILIQDFYKNLKLNARIIDLLQSLIWVLPFTAFLFLFVPRMINPFQLEKGTPKTGEIGYTPDVNISDIESLASNDSPVFQAAVGKQFLNQNLYWRGNTLSISDGWNWPLMPQDRPQKQFKPSEIKIQGNEFDQKIRVFTQQDFYFGLDHPTLFITQRGVVELSSTRTLVQNRWEPSLRYQVVSKPDEIELTNEDRPKQMRTGLRMEEKKWINDHFYAQDIFTLQKEIQVFFKREAFSYSLAPGRVENFLDFMLKKKIGFCSHYASAVAQIYRAKNIPARLVSGFQGGSYNKFAGFYLVTQNDAHVWVEAIHKGKWIRMDPTEWIAPDRILLGGEAFRREMSSQGLSAMKIFGKNFAFITDWQQWFAQWDFKFYQWLEEMDYYGQEAIWEKLRFKRQWIFSFIPIMLALFMGLYFWHLSLKKVKTTELEVIWKKFQYKMSQRGIEFSFQSIAQGDEILKSQNADVRTAWSELIEASFKNSNQVALKDLKKKIQNL
jgi:hypothetical protein